MPSGTIEPFSISVADEVLVDLRRRLRAARWPDEIDAELWRYGPPVAYMRNFVDDWINRYDWRRQEVWLNGFGQYTTDIDGLMVHFLHHQGVGPDPIPLVMTHGWPGSFVEMLRILPRLIDPAAHGGRAGGRLHRGRSLHSGPRVLRPTDGGRHELRDRGRPVGQVDGAAGPPPLRRPGGRLGLVGHRRIGTAASRPHHRHAPELSLYGASGQA